MLDPPAARGKTLPRRKPDNHADRVDASFASTSAAPTPPRMPSSACCADRAPPSIRAELALWRAFLADEIDAILLDED
jgi:hypothetical protein